MVRVYNSTFFSSIKSNFDLFLTQFINLFIYFLLIYNQVGTIIVMLQILFIENTNSIRVVDGKNENETGLETTTIKSTTTTAAKLEMPQVTTTSNLSDNNRTNDTFLHKNSYDKPMKIRYV